MSKFPSLGSIKREQVFILVIGALVIGIHLLLRQPSMCSAMVKVAKAIWYVFIGGGILAVLIAYLLTDKQEIKSSVPRVILVIVILLVAGIFALQPCLGFKEIAPELLLPSDKEVYRGPEKAPVLKWKWHRDLEENECYHVVIECVSTDPSQPNQRRLNEYTREKALNLAGRYDEFIGFRAQKDAFKWFVVVETIDKEAVSYRSKVRTFLWREPLFPTPSPTLTSMHTPTPTATPTATPAATPRCSSGYIQDPGFETSSPHWEQRSNGAYPHELIYCIEERAHSGRCFAWLAGYNELNDELYQNIDVPTNLTSATLTFWYYLCSVDMTPGNDHFNVYIRDSSGNPIITIVQLDNIDTTDREDLLYRYEPLTYYFSSADLAAIAETGGKIQIYFQVTTNKDDPTAIFIDDIVLEVCQ